MVAGLDLQPLSDETIAEMGYQGHDLWLVRIESIVFGPYETESLKHYVGDNEHLFENAMASRMDDPKMQPFWNHAVFQRRAPQVVKTQQHEGPFWVMNAGLKVGPLSFHDIDKKIEMNILGMTDHISIDDGETWIKIYDINGFDRRSHAPEELPIAPSESVFQKGKLSLVEKMEQPHYSPAEEIATMAHVAHQQAKVIQFKIEELTLKAETRTTEVSQGMKWMMPTAAAMVLTIATSGYFMFSSNDSEIIPEVAEVQAQEVKLNKRRTAPRGVVPSASVRAPASVGYNRPRESYNQDSRYPTHMETHDEFREEPQIERDPLDGPVTDVEQQPQEHSLVGNDGQQDVALDAAMNGVNQPAETVVEEASDF